MSRQRAPARAGADDDDVVVAHRDLLHTLGQDDPAGGLDQSQMREGLREVAQVSPGVDVELLGEQAQGGRDAKQALHQVPGTLPLADDREGGDEPERTDQERSLLPRQTVVGLVRLVPEHVAVLGEFVGDREHRRP